MFRLNTEKKSCHTEIYFIISNVLKCVSIEKKQKFNKYSNIQCSPQI